MTRSVQVAGVAFAAMALAQIAVPLTDDDRALTTAVVALFAVTTTALAADRWGGRAALTAAALVVTATVLLERVGTETGLPFGDYRYTGRLAPTVLGVPVAVPLAWWAMAVPARAVAARLVGPGAARVAVGAAALTAWDVLLDPQMVAEGYWVWDGGGPWRDVPLSNYAGWLLASAAVMAALDRLLPDPAPTGRPRSRFGPSERRRSAAAGCTSLACERSELPLVGLYSWWAVMSTLGFVAFFGDPLVGLVGGACMLPLAALAWRRPTPATVRA